MLRTVGRKKRGQARMSKHEGAGTATIVSCMIAPSIGICRVGNSPHGYFIGPEYPGQPIRPDGGFKDSAGRVKRQAARFRIYGLDAQGRVVRELTDHDAHIVWTVHLANRKADYFTFVGRFDDPEDPRYLDKEIKRCPDKEVERERRKNERERRNKHYAAEGKGGTRGDLVIDPGARSISGPSAEGVTFDGGTFIGHPVPLGELRTDAEGRLVVLGGAGTSASVIPNNPVKHYANNNYWFDDTSDGPVTARVILRQSDGQPLPLQHPARVIVAPPDFAPEIDNIITLYDVLEEVAVDSLGLEPERQEVSFTQDIYPVLARMARLQWVNQAAHEGHGPGTKADFLDPHVLDLLSFKPTEPADPKQAGKVQAAAAARRQVFQRLRDPNIALDDPAADDQAMPKFMPRMAGDGGDPVPGDPRTWLTLLKTQYAKFKRWAEGDFIADWAGPPRPVPMEDIPLAQRPAALTRAALQPCAGGPFYPGIEMTYVCQHPELYAAPFVLRGDLAPGEVTQSMAVPWQADFFECSEHWWPAQRPDDVVSEKTYRAVMEAVARPITSDRRRFEAVARPPNPSPGDDAQAVTWARNRFAYREKWDRGVETAQVHTARLADGEKPGDDAMTRLWSELGFVVAKHAPAPQDLPDPTKAAANPWTREDREVFVETERAPFAGLDLRECYYYLANIERFPEFLPKARWLADYLLKSAWERQHEQGYPELWRPFDYSEEAFENRMRELYEDIVTDAEAFDPNDPGMNPFRTLEDWKIRLTQFAPLNQNDGAWLHRVTPAGPLDEVQSLLFSIWSDEAGGGEQEKSHANIYTDLLRSLGIYLPDPRSRAYAFDERFLDAAFAVPVLQLAIAQFSQEMLPELLGMTLQLEWTVPGLYPVQRQAEFVGTDPHFFRLHIGIDNASDGHGAMAKRAVKLFLEQVAREGGEEAMQACWRRIWNGFVAFGDTGTLGHDLKELMDGRKHRLPVDEVTAIIERKAEFGRRNHHEKVLGGTRINGLFDQPEEFMRLLVTGNYIEPGDPDRSRFFALCGFGGPMFKVFTEEELEAWKRWTLWIARYPDSISRDKRARDDELKRARADASVSVDPGFAMASAIAALEPRQNGTSGHATVSLAGVDPVTGRPVRESVAWWFEQVREWPPRGVLAFMRALSDPANGLVVPGDVRASRLITDYLPNGGRMTAAFAEAAPRAPGETIRDVLVRWIEADCPIPQAAPDAPRLAHTLHRPPPKNVYPVQRVRGMGTIH